MSQPILGAAYNKGASQGVGRFGAAQKQGTFREAGKYMHLLSFLEVSAERSILSTRFADVVISQLKANACQKSTSGYVGLCSLARSQLTTTAKEQFQVAPGPIPGFLWNVPLEMGEDLPQL
eukprot:CAMPEP_0115554840 /NCGR_PEP_ID=MMETSP0271-20121206/97503_1 /TAXON_ID=71861 /ORGANISM="Scrippsiella trochoidea, Strain CCMP3099" /LENGTH=120 /DNA_ID=CAMNT_0002988583 /DNA_START=927 /DNA_END=1285 /DNA_ORIENTATION=+